MLRRHTRVLIAAAATAALAAPAAQAGHGQDRFEKEPTAVGSGGAAATVDALATKAAIDTLRRGGNAVDATVAAAGVLGVTEPFSAGIGGGGFMVIRTPHGKVTTIDGREKAPDAMNPSSFFENGVALSFNDARYSGLSAGVPGTVEQWDEALDRYGSMSLRKLLQPGIDVARRGFEVDQTFVDQTTAQRRLLQRHPVHGRDLPRRGRHPARRRHHATQPRPRAHVRADRRDGPRAFYRGPIARAIADAGAEPADGARRQPRVAPRADDRGRPASLRRAVAQADPDRLQGPRRVGHGPAVERRLDRRRGAQHPRGPPRSRRRTARARCTTSSRHRATRSPTATPTSPTPTTSTCRCAACSRTASRPSGGR